MHTSVIHGFEPESVFYFFEQISAIPRGSGNESGVADYLCAFARERGLSCLRDKNNNVLIRKPATAGREQDAPLLFQGHTDMVCEKNGDTVHDFLCDPIKLHQEGNRLFAEGTTLGGDDGIAVAMMLALLNGEIPDHPALECLFTTEEETGMGGAMGFDYSALRARHMINLDSEEEGQMTAGCAGGIRTDLRVPVTTAPGDGTLCRVSLTGLCGGHSGENIHCGRANANLLLARLLWAARTEVPFRLVSIAGGSKDNAIPRECEAIVSVQNPAALSMRLMALADEVAGELVPADRGCTVRCEVTGTDAGALSDPMDEASTTRVLAVLRGLPNGVLAMSHEVEGLVEFSRNLGVVRMAPGAVELVLSSRSSRDSQLDASTQALDALASLCGGTARHYSRYPGWSYAPTSAVRDAYAAAYEALYGKKLRVEVIHAGLECGYIRRQLPDMDMISVGPDMQGIHSPDEVLYLDSVARVWRTLERLIADWHVGA